jgi:hypothetical protein
VTKSAKLETTADDREKQAGTENQDDQGRTPQLIYKPFDKIEKRHSDHSYH